jgi:hypothetical protein
MLILTDGGKAMGIFEDASKRMRQKKQEENRKKAELDKECDAIMQTIMSDAVSYMNSAGRSDLSPSRNGNQVTLRLKTTSKALIITCQRAGVFTIVDEGGTQPGEGQGTLTTESMAERVVEWLEQPRPEEDKWV